MTDELHRPYHEVAQIFPLLEGEDFAALKADILANGLLEPITLHENGSILDGRNRHRACIETGVAPRFETYKGQDTPTALLAFVISKNLLRRQLTSSQRAAIAVTSEAVMQKLENDAKAREYAGVRTDPGQIFVQGAAGRVKEQAATLFQTNKQYVQDAKNLKESAPDLLDQVADGDLTIPEAKKEQRKRERMAEREALAGQAAAALPSDRWHVEQADIRTYQTTQRFDFIITDPPYPKEYLDLYGVLAERAVEWLKPTGLLLAMCGESYLDEIMQRMNGRLAYYWTGCYLTPGAPTPLRMRQVNTTWKPILIYALPGQKYTGKIFGDVWISDANDKTHHKWGQSVSGMSAIIQQVCLAGQTIFDPFMGAGTTGVAALQQGCLFYGIDIDAKNVGISRARLSEAMNDQTES